MDAMVNVAPLGSIVWPSNLSEHFSQLDYSVNDIPRFLLQQNRGNRVSLRKAQEAPRPQGFKWKALRTRLRARGARNGNVSWRRRGQIKQLANGWLMAERQIGHRKLSLALSAGFPVIKWCSRSVAKSACLLTK